MLDIVLHVLDCHFTSKCYKVLLGVIDYCDFTFDVTFNYYIYCLIYLF